MSGRYTSVWGGRVFLRKGAQTGRWRHPKIIYPNKQVWPANWYRWVPWAADIIWSIKYKSAFMISSAVWLDNTRINMLIKPLTITASESASKTKWSPCFSACNHTRLWQPLMTFSSVLKASDKLGNFLPRSIKYSYLSAQSSTTVSCGAITITRSTKASARTIYGSGNLTINQHQVYTQ